MTNGYYSSLYERAETKSNVVGSLQIQNITIEIIFFWTVRTFLKYNSSETVLFEYEYKKMKNEQKM